MRHEPFFVLGYYYFLFTSRNEQSSYGLTVSLSESNATRCHVDFCACFTLLSGKNMSCSFPGGSLGQCLRVKGHLGGCLGQFSFQ